MMQSISLTDRPKSSTGVDATRDLEENVSRSSQKTNKPLENSDDDSSTENSPITTHAQHDQISLSVEATGTDSDEDPSTRNPTGRTTHAKQNQEVDQHSTSCSIETTDDRTNQNEALSCHCEENNSENTVLGTDILNKVSSMKCNKCGKTKKLNPWWMFDEYPGVTEEIFRFLQYHNPTKTLCCNEECKTNDREDIVPAKEDRFGIVSSVGCMRCGEKMSLEINTPNSHTLSVIEKADDLKPGDEIMFRRWYGISHHAIYLGKKEPEVKDKGCCNSCCRISDDFLDVISHTFDEEDARVIQTGEWLGGIDLFRVEYDSCYPPKWTEWNAKTAQQFTKKSKQQLDSNYDPLMENCEHFARRCKTGQSESRQVRACLYNCGTNIAMLALRVTILATWWIAEAAIKDNEAPTPAEKLKLTRMEVAISTSLCIIFSTLKVVLSSIQECRKIRRKPLTNKQSKSNTGKETTTGECGKSCSTCCNKRCPKQCNSFRYLCSMLCCLVPFRLCKEFYYIIYCTGCSCECKPCSEDPILKLCCRQYVVIIMRIVVSEVIVIGIPIVFFATFEWYCEWSFFTDISLVRAAYGFLFTLPLVLILSVVHSCITNLLSRAIGCCCNRCCCCCHCCCSFRDA